ncbi:MAG: hypothetical protein ACYCU5_16415 [Actinomycetes bacterium]
MAESEGSSKKKGKKLSNAQKAGIAVGGAVVVYFLYQWYQTNQSNSAATSSTPSSQIDPLTGQPYQAGVGSLAPGASSSGSSTSGIDPATGQTYSSEIASLGQGQTSIGQELTTIGTEIGALAPTGGASVNPSGSTGAGTNTDTPSLAQWRAAQVAALSRNGLSPTEAAHQVALYLEGKPLTNVKAVQDLTNRLKNTVPPLPSGHVLPLPRLSRTATQARPTRHPVTTAAPHQAAPALHVAPAAPHVASAPISVPHQAAVG